MTLTYNRLLCSLFSNSELTRDDNDVKYGMLDPGKISNNNICID